MDKLKPCPFCGSPAEAFQYDEVSVGVRCSGDGMTCPVFQVQSLPCLFPDVAAANWNTRADANGTGVVEDTPTAREELETKLSRWYSQARQLGDDLLTTLDAAAKEARAELPTTPDPAKRDTCENCGALDWRGHVPIEIPTEVWAVRFCGHCGRGEMLAKKCWIKAYPGKGAGKDDA